MMLRLHDVLIVQRRQDTRNGRLADFTALGLRIHPDRLHDGPEILELLDLDNLEKIDARHIEVDAQTTRGRIWTCRKSEDSIREEIDDRRYTLVVELLAKLLHFGLVNACNDRYTTTTS